MLQAIRKPEGFRVREYLTWSGEERWEIIDGELHDMSPAPRVKHQDIVGGFFLRLKGHPENPCYTGIAPTDIILDDHNVVQPDLFLVCDREKITDDNVQGAPDLVVEVVSPSTEVKDRREKLRLYERFGVKEYWIVFPESEYLERSVLESGRFGSPEIFNWDETLTIALFPMDMALWEIFDKNPPKPDAKTPPP